MRCSVDTRVHLTGADVDNCLLNPHEEKVSVSESSAVAITIPPHVETSQGDRGLCAIARTFIIFGFTVSISGL